MNHKYDIQLRTPTYVSSKGRHSHQLSSPLTSESLFIDTTRAKKMSQVGEQVLKKCDFFSDPFSVPEKYQSNSPLIMKTEQTIIENDSIDYILNHQITDRSHHLQALHQRCQSDRMILPKKRVKFNNEVSVRGLDGQDTLKPIQPQSKQIVRRSRFSRNQNEFVQN